MVVAHAVTVIKPGYVLPTQHHRYDFIGAQTTANFFKEPFWLTLNILYTAMSISGHQLTFDELVTLMTS